MHADIAQVPLDRILFDISVTAVQLQRVVADLKTDIGRETFCHRGVHRCIWIADIQARGRAVDHEARRLQLRRHIRQLELKGLEIRQSLTELLALQHIITREVEAFAGCPDRTGRNIDPPAIESLHRDLEPVALFANPVDHRHAAILENDAAVG